MRTASSGANSYLMMFDTTTGEIARSTQAVGNTGKTFVIDHPLDKSKYLVHGCLEGPEVGVYYRGKGKITNNGVTIVQLPDYVCEFSTNFTVQLTPKYNPNIKEPLILTFSDIEINEFKVYGPNDCEFHWHVYGERNSLTVEPNKKDVKLKGTGPYRWIE